MSESGNNKPYLLRNADPKYRIDDMNASTSGIARQTVVVTASSAQIYRYSGTGLVHGFVVNYDLMKSNDVRLTFEIDGQNIFFESGILDTDMGLFTYNLTTFRRPGVGGKKDQQCLWGLGLTAPDEPGPITWNAPNGLPIFFNSSIAITMYVPTSTTSLSMVISGATFDGGFIGVTKYS